MFIKNLRKKLIICFAIIINKSTHISTNKELNVYVKYFNELKNCIAGLFEVGILANAKNLSEIIINYLEKNQILIRNMIRFGFDNCLIEWENSSYIRLSNFPLYLISNGCELHLFNLTTEH